MAQRGRGSRQQAGSALYSAVSAAIERSRAHEDGAHDALDEGRERWRRLQVRAAVRDAPHEAADVLAHLGYTVAPPEGGHATDNLDRMRSL